MAMRKQTQHIDSPTDENFEYNNTDEPIISKRKELDLVRRTETIDRLLIQNKTLQKELNDAEREIDILETKLDEHTIKISKNLFYTFIGTIIIIGYFINSHLDNVNNKLVEISVIMQTYKTEIDIIKESNKPLLPDSNK